MKQDTRIHVPLLTGGYSPKWRIRAFAQMYFLSIVSKVAPSPLYDLRDNVLPAYRAAFEAEAKRKRPVGDIRKLSRDAIVDIAYSDQMKGLKLPREFRDAVRAHPKLYEASRALFASSRAFNLRGMPTAFGEHAPSNDDDHGFESTHWPIVTALETILFWHFHPVGSVYQQRNPPMWRPPILDPKIAHSRKPEILPSIQLGDPAYGSETPDDVAMYGWAIEEESPAQFRKRMHRALDRWLVRYISKSKAVARAAGMIPHPTKQKLTLHFEWAAKYQIDKISRAKLANEYGVSEATVDDGISDALELIYLQRRHPQRGVAKVHADSE